MTEAAFLSDLSSLEVEKNKNQSTNATGFIELNENPIFETTTFLEDNTESYSSVEEITSTTFTALENEVQTNESDSTTEALIELTTKIITEEPPTIEMDDFLRKNLSETFKLNLDEWRKLFFFFLH